MVCFINSFLCPSREGGRLLGTSSGSVSSALFGVEGGNMNFPLREAGTASSPSIGSSFTRLLKENVKLFQ